LAVGCAYTGSWLWALVGPGRCGVKIKIERAGRVRSIGITVGPAVCALVAVALLVGLAGCKGRVRVGPLQTETRSVELGGAHSVGARVTMGAGTLNITGGSDQLLDAEFRYNVAEWKPQVSYAVAGDRGTLSVEQPKTGRISLARGVQNEWDLRLGEGVPLDLTIELGAGRGTLELGSVSLGTLDINAGAGEVELDLTGAPSVTKLQVRVGAGSVKMDLTGEWKADLYASIEGGVGSTALRLPEDVGVRVTAKRGFGSINAAGFTRDGDAYVNEAYGNSKVTLSINIQTGLGEINLEQGSPAEENGNGG
jgi:hypothetical protein